MNTTRWMIALSTLLLSGAVYAADMGSALKADDIRMEPFRDAKSVAKLSAGDSVEILKKNGGWLQIKSAKGSGWVRMLSIRKGDARKGDNNASGLLALSSGRAGTGKVVASTGIRGLDMAEMQKARFSEDALKEAKFNEAELKKAESYAVGKSEAALFAAQGKLVARKFDYLPAPK